MKKIAALILIFTWFGIGSTNASEYNRRGFALGLDGQYFHISGENRSERLSDMWGFQANGRYVFRKTALFAGGKIGYLNVKGEKDGLDRSDSLISGLLGGGYEFFRKKPVNLELGIWTGLVHSQLHIGMIHDRLAQRQDINEDYDNLVLMPSIAGDVKWSRNWGVRLETAYCIAMAKSQDEIQSPEGVSAQLGVFYQF